jgi:NADH-quinone oxidoreductase chain G
VVKIFINNYAVYVPSKSTILEACEFSGIDVPRFCFHERLSVAGNCRACLVEVEKSPKPVVSCTLPIVKNLRIFTESPLVKKTRESVLEFLLLNHPLDCPICDQGGECDLQDHSIFFGSNKTRFFETKRGVKNKNCGPLVKTIMTRCIHCTRCIRFFSKYTGYNDLGITNRSNFAEIGTFINKFFQSELSGNVIDLCPVGALTSKAYSFVARPWELRTIETIDNTDAVGSNIKIDFKETTPVRILPKINESINEGWITDKCRFNMDSFFKFRIGVTYFRKKGNLKSTSWKKCFRYINYLITFCDISMLCSVYSDLETLIQAKFFAAQHGFKNLGYARVFYLNIDFFENFLCTLSLTNIETCDFCLLVGLNPKWETSALNIKLLRRFRNGLFNAISLGIHHNNSFKRTILGISPKILLTLSEGKHFLCKKIKKSKNPIILHGASIAERKDFMGLKKILQHSINLYTKIASKHSGLCFVNQEKNQVGAFCLGLKTFDFSFNPQFRVSQLFSQLHSQSSLTNEKIFFLLGTFRSVEINYLEKKIPLKSSRIILSSYGCDFTAKADLLLPIKNFLEKEGYYHNIEGRVQKTQKVFCSLLPASKIESSLLDLFRKNSYKTHDYNRNWKDVKNLYSLEQSFSLEKSFFLNGFYNKGNTFFSPFIKTNTLSSVSFLPFTSFLTDYFNADPFSKFSSKMVKCSTVQRILFKNFF